ncbi:MAG: dihydrodipicolinate synthase family protein [candidate division NC10 bacterium]|nr:dihydrodipicolinate synthase family protein [candidate division NC10 bacterium]
MRRVPEGVCPILATPFTEKGEIDFDSLGRLTRWISTTGAVAVTMFGIGSEYYKLSDQERNSMIECVLAEAKGKIPVIVSVTKHATELAVEDALYAQKMGADMLMLLPPFLLSPGPEATTHHIESVCQAVDIPVIVQYAPEMTGVKIGAEVFIGLARKYPQIAYKIECKPPGKVITAIREGSGGSVKIYVGNAGFQLIEGLARGAVGVMPGCSMIEVYGKIYALYAQGRIDEAVAVHNELLPLLNCMRQSVEELIKGEKMILKRRGVIASDYCRKPTFVFDEALEKDLDRYYRQVEKYL